MEYSERKYNALLLTFVSEHEYVMSNSTYDCDYSH